MQLEEIDAQVNYECMVNKSFLFNFGFNYGENTLFETEDNMVPSKLEKISFPI